jgi:rRNA maturation endonuclease Nob1
VIIFYYKCENCGQIYYSAAELSGDMLICEICGGVIRKVDPDELKKEVDE